MITIPVTNIIEHDCANIFKMMIETNPNKSYKENKDWYQVQDLVI